ncbi:hypothetical protein J7E70_07750 [Variovorax paradoxus]|nr:hypothetical protein [Variovorax paradoxus]MBT2300356.1 hypothetical protein [Variovorax paradoxus]
MIFLSFIPACWAMWLIYVAMMRLKQVQAEGKLTLAMKILGYPILVFGLALDFLLNVIVGSMLFLEVPREKTLSERLWRHSQTSTGYRQKLAEVIRVNLLDSIDPEGIHRG